MAHAFYAKAGIVIDHAIFSKLEKKKIVPTVWTVATFADAVVGLILFLAKAGRQALLTKSVDSFFVDEKVVTDWIETASRLRKDAEFLGNPAAVSIDLPTFVNDVRNTIVDGNRLLRIFSKGPERAILHSVLLELESCERRFTSVMVASSFRRCPIGVFIYGGSGVAKSFIAQGLFHHFCSVRGIDKSKATLWTRTEGDKFYSGYKSHFAGALFDDAAQHNPSVVNGVDPSIGEIISAVNNIPFITPQAELCDKGKIPFLSEWVGVTSNVHDLNADVYYKSSNAFLRRLPYRIEPVVKLEFCLKGTRKIDPSKIPPDEQYPDLWIFEVSRVQEEGLRGKYVRHKTFDSYTDLLAFMTDIYTEHIKNQDKLMATVGSMGPEPLCVCGRPSSACNCDSGSIVLCRCGEPTLSCQCMLFGPAAVTQARSPNWGHKIDKGSLKKDDHACRLFRIASLEREIVHSRFYSGAEKLFCNQLFEEGLFADLKKADVKDYNCENYTAALLHHFAQAMDEFQAMPTWKKISVITDIDYKAEGDNLDFLSFKPTKGQKCFFMEGQISKLEVYILGLIGSTFTDAEEMLLKQYLYEFAPRFISEGWPTKDLVRGAVDYVKYFGKSVEDPTRLAVRDNLLDDRNDRTWYQSLIVRVSGWYFGNRYFYAICNHLSGYRVVQWLFRGNYYFALCRLFSRAKDYDAELKGKHPYIRAMVIWASTIGVLAFAAAIISKMIRKPEAEHTEAFEGTTQLSVHPVVREEEKQNVWVTKERTITKFDYHPDKPNSLEQMMAKTKGNCLVAEIHYPCEGTVRSALTRVVALNSRTLVINNHACFDTMRMTIWLDKKTPEGVQPTVELNICESMVQRYPSRDIAFISTLGLPSLFKDISACFPYESMTAIGPAFYLIRGEDGELVKLSCHGLTKRKLCRVAVGDQIDSDMWSCHPDRPTVSGECGSPLFVITSGGPVMVGIHAAYSASAGVAYAAPLFCTDFPEGKFPQRGVITDRVPVLQAKRLAPGAKLYTDFHEKGSMLVHGQVDGFRARPKATGGHTQIAHHVLDWGETFDPPIEDRMARPEMGSWKQPQRVLSQYLIPTHSMREDVWAVCIDAFKRHITRNLTDVDRADIHTVDMDVAVNGFPGVPNVDAIKFTTSGGHGRRGPKSKYFTPPCPNGVWEHYREPIPELRQDIEKMTADAKMGMRPHAVYTAVLKDEMLSKAKVAAGKTRCIYMCPVDFLVSMRMVTLGITRVMVRRKEIFRHSVGLNTHSEEWNDLLESANKIPGDNWVAGDYAGYDTILSLLISNGVSEIFIHCAEIGQFDDEELLWLTTMLADCSNATVDFFGTLVTLLGGEVSGHQLTTFFNSIANTLLHMYAYVLMTCALQRSDMVLTADSYFEYVFNTTLGDDVFLKVHPDASHYNHTSIKQLYSEIGITYTMADKNAPSIPYISWKDVTFLKRSFAHHESFPGLMVAPLERQSIYKMLLYTVPSSTISPEEQLAQAMCAAVTESFYHGKDFFDQIVCLIDDVPKSDELCFRMREYPIPTWELLVKRFLKASPKYRALLDLPEGYLENIETTRASYCQPEDLEFQMARSVERESKTTLGRSPLERIYAGVTLSSKPVPKRWCNVDKPDVENPLYSKEQKKHENKYTGKQDVARPVLLQATRELLRKERRDWKKDQWLGRDLFEGEFQMEVSSDSLGIPTTADESKDLGQQTVVFKNEPVGKMVDLSKAHTRGTSIMEMPQNLGSYLSRPRLIATYSWPENSSDGNKSQFFPWQAYFASSDMSNKLQGYSMLSADLHLKFLVNGSPFYYGGLMASYTPFSGIRTDTGQGASNLTLICASQKPHVWLNNQSVSTAQMVLPFLYPYDYVDIASTGSLADIGDVRLVQYAPLLSANGLSGGTVDIQVYAWAENVKLTGPTARAVVQSKPSEMMSSIAYGAKKLDVIPGLAPYTNVVAKGAQVASDVAAFFGFTNDPVVDDVKPVKQVPFQLASTEISEPVMKLSLQPKQSIAIGSSQHGGPDHDELDIAHMAQRSSFLVGTDWLTTALPNEILFTGAVSPLQNQINSGAMAHTPMSYISQHFQWWRGTIRYTFKVIRSPYHRGRIQISWDRLATVFNLGVSIGDPDVYSVVMDLDETDEVTVDIPYMQPEKFLATYEALVATGGVPYDTSSAPPATSWALANGLIQVRVVNRLTAPETTSTARILVFVSAGDDIEFAGPRDLEVLGATQVVSLSNLTSAVVQTDFDQAVEETRLTQDSMEPDVYKEVFGERATSLREVLHRSSLAFSYVFNNTTTSGESVISLGIPFKHLPPAPGIYNNGWSISTTSSGTGQRTFNTRFHPITSIGACFIGYKGSVNVTTNFNNPAGIQWIDSLSVSRTQDGASLSAISRRPIVFEYQGSSYD